jgi:tRNA(fMet)-specific endonuclease VapC
MFILDTDLLTLAFRGRGPDADKLHKRLSMVSRDEVATTIVNYEEQTRGWLSFAAKAKDVAGLVDAYRKLEQYLESFKKIPLLSFTEAAAVEFQRL